MSTWRASDKNLALPDLHVSPFRCTPAHWQRAGPHESSYMRPQRPHASAYLGLDAPQLQGVSHVGGVGDDALRQVAPLRALGNDHLQGLGQAPVLQPVERLHLVHHVRIHCQRCCVLRGALDFSAWLQAQRGSVHRDRQACKR